jgi:hypothetical protein
MLKSPIKALWPVFLLVFIIFFPSKAFASIFINEIAWMGTLSSSNDEWIELYNDGNETDLSGWKIIAKDGSPNISLSGKILKNGFYLLERTDDNTVPDITADQIYTVALGNTGETLELYDNTGNIIDSINCSSGWINGDNTTKQTMEKISSGWQTSEKPGGTPKEINGMLQVLNNQKTEEKVSDTQKNELLIFYPDGILINELLPSPEGSDEDNEWVELYNQNKEKVDLSGWKIKDSVGATTTFTIPQGTEIKALGFLLFYRNTTKIILNNDNDEISLIKPDLNVTDKVSYEKAVVGQSYNRISNNWVWSKTPTPEKTNSIETNLKVTQKNNDIKINEIADNEGNQIQKSQNLTGEQKTKSSTRFFIIVMASLLALTSGIIILFIKKKLNKQTF